MQCQNYFYQFIVLEKRRQGRSKIIVPILCSLISIYPAKKATVVVKALTLYQTTNFEQYQIESICRRQDKCDSKIKKCFAKGRKHFGKRRKCRLPKFSPFPKMFSKAFFFRVVKCRDCVAKS